VSGKPHEFFDHTGSAFDFHTTLAGMLSTPSLGHELVQLGSPSQKRLLATFGILEAFHHEPLPVDGVMGLSQLGWNLTFPTRRHWLSAPTYRYVMAQRFQSWYEVTGTAAT
jgi:hypothetical protein